MPGDPSDSSAKTNDSKQREKHKDSLPDQSRPRSFYDIKGLLQQAAELSGDINNQIVSTVTHHDLAQKFTQPVTVNLAKEYLAGRDIINQRKASGKSADDWSGLNKDELLCVKAYQQLHNNLPAQIPFVDRDGLLRSVERSLENKVKLADQRPHPRAEAESMAKEQIKSQAKVGADLEPRSPLQSAESNRRSLSTSDYQAKAPRPHPPEAKELRGDSGDNKSGNAHKVAPVAAEKNTSEKNVLEKNGSEKVIKEKAIAEKTISEKGSKEKTASAAEGLSAKEIPPPHISAKAERWQSGEKTGDKVFERNNGQKPKIDENKTIEKISLGRSVEKNEDKSHRESKPVQIKPWPLAERFMPRSSAAPEWLLSKYQTFLARAQDVKISPCTIRNIPVANSTVQLLRSNSSREGSLLKQWVQEKIAAAGPLELRQTDKGSFSQALPSNDKAKSSPAASGTGRPLPAGAETVRLQSGSAGARAHATSFVKKESLSTEAAQVPLTIPALQSRAYRLVQNNQSIAFGQSFVSTDKNSFVAKTEKAGSITPTIDVRVKESEMAPSTGTEKSGSKKEIKDAETDEKDLVDQLGRPLTKTFIVRGLLPEKRFITGGELAFVAVMALASASRLRSAASVERALDNSGRAYVLVEEECLTANYFLPENTKTEREGAKSTDNNIEINSYHVESDESTSPASHIIDKRESKTRAAAPARKTLLRPQILVQEGDSLTEMAEALFNDSRFGHLIADLNINSTQQSEVEGARVVRLLSRQKLSLPVYQDLLDYDRTLKIAAGRPLITIVESSGLDRELLHEGLASMLGINSKNTDPLQNTVPKQQDENSRLPVDKS